MKKEEEEVKLHLKGKKKQIKKLTFLYEFCMQQKSDFFFSWRT